MCKPAVTWSIKAIIFWLLIEAFFFRYIFYKSSVHTLLYLKQKFSFSLDNHSVIFLNDMFSIFLSQCMILLFVCLILKKKQVSFRDIGIQPETRFRTWSGLIILGALFNAIVWLIQYHYVVRFTPLTIEQSHWAFTLGVYFFILVLLGPFIEEVVFRGILFQSLRNQLSVVPAIAINALIFTALHDGFDSWVHVIGVLLAGCITCVIFFQTSSLTNAFIFHASMNMTGIILKYIFWIF